jgi:hypothetical protein
MATTKVKMDETELMRRSLEPGQKADERKKQAKVFIKSLQARDDENTARIGKLRALRLAAAAAAAAAAPPVPAKPTPKARVRPPAKPMARSVAKS